jgi:antitoxin CptB
MDEREEWNRARWASRRGLLELDLLLSPFVEQRFQSLEPELRQRYREMLFQDDQDLLDWIMGRSQVTAAAFAPVIMAIRAHHQLDQ